MGRRKKQLNLPNIFSKFIWEKGGSRKEFKKHIGRPYLSWSAVDTWTSKKSFNFGVDGRIEFIHKYFLRHKIEHNMFWSEFGSDVEDYIRLKKRGEKFSDEEKQTLDKIKPLGEFERMIIWDLGTFIVIGFIDDIFIEDKIAVELYDYKTKSESGKNKLVTPENHQIETYHGGLLQEKITVTKSLYKVIERNGGRKAMLGGGRQALTIGGRIWELPVTVTEERLKQTEELYKKKAIEIADCYTYFQNEVRSLL